MFINLARRKTVVSSIACLFLVFTHCAAALPVGEPQHYDDSSNESALVVNSFHTADSASGQKSPATGANIKPADLIAVLLENHQAMQRPVSSDNLLDAAILEISPQCNELFDSGRSVLCLEWVISFLLGLPDLRILLR